MSYSWFNYLNYLSNLVFKISKLYLLLIKSIYLFGLILKNYYLCFNSIILRFIYDLFLIKVIIITCYAKKKNLFNFLKLLIYLKLLFYT